MRRSLHIAGKDVTVWIRDVAAMGVLLGMPIVLIVILGSALGGAGEQSRIPVAIVNLDEGVVEQAPGEPPSSSKGYTHNIGQEIVELLGDSDRLKDVFEPSDVASTEIAHDGVAGGSYAAALVIPSDFSARVRSGEPVSLVVMRDPGARMSAGIFESVVRSLAARYSAISVAVQTGIEGARQYRPEAVAFPDGLGRLQARIVEETERSALGSVTVAEAEADVEEQMTALDFYGVSMTAMFLMFGAMFGAFSTIKERREQTLSRLMSTPTSGLAVTAGKMLGIFGLGMVQFTVLYVFTRYLFGVNWGKDVLATYLVAAAEVLAVTGLALVISSLTKTERGAGGLGPLLIQIQALVGGAFFSISVLPLWLQPIRFASIVGWAIEGWQEVQLRGGGVGDVLTPVMAMLGFAVVFFAFGAWRTGARG